MSEEGVPTEEVGQSTTGEGKFYYENGAIYEGEWILQGPEEDVDEAGEEAAPVEGEEEAPPPPPKVYVRQGKGKYTEGEYSYEGEWDDDTMAGEGTFAFASGSTYSGTFKSGKYEGQGQYIWADGTKYIGEWADGVMHGSGVYTDKEGREWSGKFFNGSGPGLSAIL